MSRVERHAAEDAAKKRKPGKTGAEKKSGRKGRVTFLGHLIRLIGVLIMLAAVASCLAFTTPAFMKMDSYVVISGSMEPEIPEGSLIFTKKADPATLAAGDVIVYSDYSAGEVYITHRVVENDADEEEVITKGDANDENDLRPVKYKNVRGKYFKHVPFLGFMAAPFGTLMGKIAMGMILLAGLLLTAVGGNMRRK